MRRRIISIIVSLLFIGGGGYFLYGYAYDAGHYDGYLEGYKKGYENPDSAAVVDQATFDLYENYLTVFLDRAVFVTRTGEKYHRVNCQYVRNHEYWIQNVENAQFEGYSPCSVCFGMDAHDYLSHYLQ